jgi:hypothetical protein
MDDDECLLIDVKVTVVFRCAPNGSAYNKVERCMSQCNIAHSNVSTKRAVMPKWAEDAIKHCGSMNNVRAKAEVMN